MREVTVSASCRSLFVRGLAGKRGGLGAVVFDSVFLAVSNFETGTGELVEVAAVTDVGAVFVTVIGSVFVAVVVLVVELEGGREGRPGRVGATLGDATPFVEIGTM